MTCGIIPGLPETVASTAAETVRSSGDNGAACVGSLRDVSAGLLGLAVPSTVTGLGRFYLREACAVSGFGDGCHVIFWWLATGRLHVATRAKYCAEVLIS